MLVFFIFLNALVSFTAGFAIACMMAEPRQERRLWEDFERRQREVRP